MDSNLVPLPGDAKSRKSCLYTLFPAVCLLFLALFIANAIISPDFQPLQKLSGFKVPDTLLKSGFKVPDNLLKLRLTSCQNVCMPPGSEALPQGILQKESNLQMRPLWGFPEREKSSMNLFAMAVGIKQSDLVDKMVRKFLSSKFVVMLFHYDGNVDGWDQFDWNHRVIHVSAVNQTKWWFAKRFLHPDIVAEYDYIFLWDEDLGVDNFNPQSYVSIVKKEGLEISQPALDPNSEVHHQITARLRKDLVHRRTYKPGDNGCNGTSKTPPCTGWIEMMAPVFSRDSWRCVWYMIQNDLIHAWGLDTQLGYCAKGDRTMSVGVVDAEYIVHHNRPTLGAVDHFKKKLSPQRNKTRGRKLRKHVLDPRVEVRRQSYLEFVIFRKRWEKAVDEDKCWVDPYPQ